MSNDTDEKIISGMGIPPLEECSGDSDKTPYGGIKVNMRTDGFGFSHAVHCRIDNNLQIQYADKQELDERIEDLLNYLHSHRESINEAEKEGFSQEQYADIQKSAEKFEHLLGYLHSHRVSMREAGKEGFLREWNEIKDSLRMSCINKPEYLQTIDQLFRLLFDGFEYINEAEKDQIIRETERAFAEFLSYL